MDTVRSFKGYGKVDPLEEQAFRRKSRKRIIILVVSLILLVALIIGVVAATVAHSKNKNGGRDDAAPSTQTSSAQSLKAMCSVSLHPQSCYDSVSSLEDSNSTNDPQKLFQLSLRVILYSLDKLSTLPQEWINNTSDPQVKDALRVCQTVFQDAIEAANDSLSSLNANDGQSPLSDTGINNLKTWLSTSLTDLDTCADALEEINATILDEVKTAMNNSTEFVSNSLAIVSKFLTVLGKFNSPTHRKLLDINSGDSEYPEWVRAADRRLLQASGLPKPDVTVAQDGTGNFRTITAAVAKIPKKSKKRFVIYVKAGVYKEKVLVDKPFWNVMFYGDGKDKTTVTFDSNKIDGTPTFETATFAATGKNFIARNMRFRNTAGPSKHQAVAFRSGSDQSVFYQCSFEGYQDTLYSHSNRQFYRECDITGTVDFIFGNAAAVFQNCNIMPRQPLPNQFVTITAQGKKDPNQNTGIVIQNCVMTPFDRLTVPTYLGRPWKDYSTTIVMQTTIGSFLHPDGWTEWVPDVLPPSTIFYAEHQNSGPGSGVAKRVKWSGYKSSLTPTQAAKFTVGSFINGKLWIPESTVKFT